MSVGSTPSKWISETGARSLFAGPQALFAGPQAPFAGPQALFAGPQALFAGPQALFAGPGTSFAGPQALFAGKEALPFGRRQRRVRGPRLPVVAVTGFLGSGKTTLIRALLARPEGANTAIVVNEFGEIGIDQALLRSSSDVTVLLGNGCLCCNIRTDLQETLRALFADRARGAVPSFVRVIIETSGLADPGPVLQTFATDRGLGREFHLQALVTVVDALSGERNLEHQPEARKQVALADRIILTKSDVADADAIRRLRERIAALSVAPVAIASNGAVSPGFVLDEPAAPGRDAGFADSGFADTGFGHTHGLDGIESFALTFEAPLGWAVFEQAMAVLTALRGPDLLRVKGIVAITECRGPVVVHAVQHVAHPPVELEDWPDADHRSRLVFITRNLPRERVAQLFSAVGGVIAVPSAKTPDRS
ncbi:MAG: CobW family GTP-binding protein [Stellaceae bacterium]